MTAPLNQSNTTIGVDISGNNVDKSKLTKHNVPGDAIIASYTMSNPAGGADVTGTVAGFFVVPAGKILMVKNVDVISLGTAASIDGSNTALIAVEKRSLPAVANAIVTTATMANAAYTVVGQPDVPRPITVTHTAVSTVDTLGIITVVGTDFNDAVISEAITPLNGTIATSLQRFKTVTSVTGSGWAGVAGDDSIVVGYAATTGDVVATKTFTTVASFPLANVSVPLTLSADKFAIEAGEVLVPRLTQGTTADLPSFVIQVYGTLIDA